MKVRAYKFYSAKWGLEALRHRRLKISTDVDINDPFEFLATGPRRNERLAASRFRKEFFRQNGIISFSRTWHQPLLWSHYGENHRGIAIGFDLYPKIWRPVIYTSERLNWQEFNSKNKFIEGAADFSDAMRTVKFSAWVYEDEVRIFPRIDESIHQDGLFFSSFSDIGELREIIIGAQYENDQDTALHEILARKRISIKTARLAFNDFSVRMQKDKKRQKRL